MCPWRIRRHEAYSNLVAGMGFQTEGTVSGGLGEQQSLKNWSGKREEVRGKECTGFVGHERDLLAFYSV